jgi:hypothetical protein
MAAGSLQLPIQRNGEAMKGQKLGALVAAMLLLCATDAAAQLTSAGVLDQVISAFATRASAWQTIIMNAATWLFWTLGTISLVWTFGFLGLAQGGYRRLLRGVHPIHSVFRIHALVVSQRAELLGFDHSLFATTRRQGRRNVWPIALGHRRCRLHDLEAGSWEFVGVDPG